MTEVNFAALSQLDVDLNFISTGKNIWRNGGREDRFITVGRRCDLLFYMIEGNRDFFVNGELITTLEPGEAIFIPTGAVYYSEIRDRAFSEGIYIDFTMKNDGGQIIVGEPFYRLSDEGLRRRFEAVVENRADRLRAKADIYRLLSEFSSSAAVSGLGPEEQAVRNVMLEIARHPELQFETSRLARDCCLSETGFRKLFKKCSGGLSALEYRNHMRIERADELLSTGSFTVEQIADLLGFYDKAHFYRMYRQHRGHSPMKG